MARGNILKLQVQQDIYDSKSMLDETNWYAQRHGGPDELFSRLTYLLGDNTKNFPISMMTYGNVIGDGKLKKKGNTKEISDIQFDYPVISRTYKTSTIATTEYSGTDRAGIGNQSFYITFTDNWIKRHYIIESPRNIQAYVVKDPEPVSGGFRYECILDPALPTDYCPISELEAGVEWIELNTANPESESTGTEFKRVAPGKYKNQMTVVRLSRGWAGNASDKVMKFKFSTDKGEVDNWMDFETWLFEKAWLEELEHNYWYSRYNRQADGTIALKDLLSGKVIPRGSGLLEQIPNKYTYSKLTYNKLQNTVTDALYGQYDADGMSITLHTGRGGMREIDSVLKKQGALVLGAFGSGNVADKFVSGSMYNLALGGFFDTMYHIDGYVLKVKHNPIFDYGRRAMKSPKHPETGLPLESYRMVFIDDSDYDGEPNLVHVTQKGRQFIHGIVPGLTNIPKSIKLMGGFANDSDVKLMATDQDKASYHRMSVCGINLRRASKCIHLECTMGL